VSGLVSSMQMYHTNNYTYEIFVRGGANLNCAAVWFGWEVSTLRRNLLPPSHIHKIQG